MRVSPIVFLAVIMLAISVVAAAAEEETYKSSVKRDPFVSLISPTGVLINLEPEQDAALRLEGITYDPHGDSVVIINGELVRRGEEIGGAMVAEIESNKVTLIRDNKKIDLELRREE